MKTSPPSVAGPLSPAWRVRARSGWLLAVGATFALVVLAAIPPFVGETARRLLMAAFHAVCHQLPNRSPHLDGISLAVCHRCYGIYLGLAAGTLAFGLLARWDGWIDAHRRALLFASLAVPGADWLLGVTGLWANTPASRLATGAVFGVVAGYLLARSLGQLFAHRALRAEAEEAPSPSGRAF